MSVRLVEREAELTAIDDGLAAVATGAGTALIVEGPAGIGKTVLLGAARARAEERGFRVLTARGGELEGAFAYGVARQLFEPALLAVDGAERERLLDGPAAMAAQAILGTGGESQA